MESASASGTVIRHASDHTILAAFGDEVSLAAHRRVRAALHALQREPIPGVTNLHPAYASVLVSYDPLAAAGELVAGEVARRVQAAGAIPLPGPALVEIPVRYGGEWGPDLAAVATACGLTEAEVAREHAAAEYLVYFLGFSPGFAYLGGLPPGLATARRASPRTLVPAGSVAIGGRQTGVYPLASPGGWQLIGRTPLALFDPARTPPALLAAGDRVRFVAVAGGRGAASASSATQAAPATVAGAAPARAIRVVAPGFQSTVQDLGRPGWAHLGVSASGAADPVSLRIGNWLVGNPAGAAAIEMTLTGAALSFSAACVVAVIGSDFEPAIDGASVPLWAALEVGPGQTLACRATKSGARCAVCVRGGVAAPPVLGSASTHLTSGLGGVAGRPLRAGDVLTTGAAAADAAAGRRFPAEAAERLLRRDAVRVTRGPQWERFTPQARAALFASEYVVSESASRMGLRLDGTPLAADRPGEMLTEGVSLGALQVPGDGRPIVSFVEHQTTGGYPQIACVITADLHRVGQLRPRDRLSFVEVSLAEAAAALRELERELRAFGVGR
ncbi:MAG: 5-oxoprolinase subunit PxpB [Acidobacteria bacterium]|nr:MAG: 5-oxoprolinase subunit PxpB [Acidobacteriota bacterium]